MRGSICSVRVRLSHLSIEVFFGCCSFYALLQQKKTARGGDVTNESTICVPA